MSEWESEKERGGREDRDRDTRKIIVWVSKTSWLQAELLERLVSPWQQAKASAASQLVLLQTARIRNSQTPKNGERREGEMRKQLGHIRLTFSLWILLKTSCSQKSTQSSSSAKWSKKIRKTNVLRSNPTCNKSPTLSPVRHFPGLHINSHCWHLCWLRRVDLCSRLWSERWAPGPVSPGFDSTSYTALLCKCQRQLNNLDTRGNLTPLSMYTAKVEQLWTQITLLSFIFNIIPIFLWKVWHFFEQQRRLMGF